ncbi:hypothetical protein [Neomoorella glycerini]|uniref:hypothetical protein n=1 Tax=Neomoorella glycerini TaxID=55779 RepID=UPI0012E0EEE6|nr:hypothetical protein [Moorella glycerini]
MQLQAHCRMVKIDTECKTTQFVGKITGEILKLLPYQETSEVVLTGERLEKNKRHHRDIDDEAYQLLPEIIAKPDYVCIDKDDKQVVAFYYYRYENYYLRAVILLKTPQDSPHYKNSIQSFRVARRLV